MKHQKFGRVEGLMDELYKNWRCAEAPRKNCHSVKKPCKEAL